MSCTVYVLSDPLFDTSTEPMSFFLPALLLQNYEHCKTNARNDSSFFFSYIESLLFKDEAQFSDREGSKFEENCEKLRKIFERLRDQELADFYKFMKENSSMTMFCNLLKLAVQRLLLVLFKGLTENNEGNSVLKNSYFVEGMEAVETWFIQDQPVIVMIFLQLLRKNCILCCDPQSNFKSKTFVIDSKYPTLYLYMDKDKEFQFMLLKKPFPDSEAFYQKLTIQEDSSIFTLGVAEEVVEEEEEAEEDEIQDKQKKKPEKLTYQTALDEFVDRFLEKISNNIPNKSNEKKAKEKLSEQIYSYINEKERFFGDEKEFRQWKEACQRFQKRLLDLDLTDLEEVEKFKKKTMNR